TAGDIVDSAPACDFTVVLVKPKLEITSPKMSSVTGQVVTFSFDLVTGDPSITTFQCSEDDGPLADCVTNQNRPLMGMYAQGSMHKLTVGATDAAGQTDSASVTFMVGTGPTVEIALSPEVVEGKFVPQNGVITLTTLGSEPHVVFNCTLDGVAVPGNC